MLLVGLVLGTVESQLLVGLAVVEDPAAEGGRRKRQLDGLLLVTAAVEVGLNVAPQQARTDTSFIATTVT